MQTYGVIRRMVRTASYLDRAPQWYDMSNRVFYVYSLGRFHNTPMYHYGETSDIDLVEFEMKKRVPYYKRVIYVPLDEDANDSLRDIIKQKEKVSIPVTGMETWNAFTAESIDDMLQIVEESHNFQDW